MVSLAAPGYDLRLSPYGCVLGIYGVPHVIEAGGPEDDVYDKYQRTVNAFIIPENDASRSKETGDGEEPEEESVEHHGHVLPVLHHLIVLVIVPDVLGYELHTLQGCLNLQINFERMP